MCERTYKVECDKGHDYTQTSDQQPYKCGACGCTDIRVWAIVYDALTPTIKRRIAERERTGQSLG